MGVGTPDESCSEVCCVHCDLACLQVADLKDVISGDLAILDGIHRLPPETISVLSPLLHDSMLSLPNGWQLMRQDRFESLMEVHFMPIFLATIILY